jgi:hypothetical protein
MLTSKRDYYRQRIEEEQRRASSENNSNVRHVHETLVALYRTRLDAE